MEGKLPVSLSSANESILENFLEKSPFGFSLVTGDYVLDYANDAWLELAQIKIEDVIGKNVFEVFPETKDQLYAILEEVKRTRTPFHGSEYCIKLIRDGVLQDVYFNFVYHPIIGDDGEFQYFAGIGIEITDFVGIKNQIKEDEERLRLATEGSSTATWDLNLVTSEVVHSTFLSQIFGYGNDENISREQFRNHILEEDRTNVVDIAFQKALESGTYQYEARILDVNGKEKWIATHGKILFDDDHQPIRMVGVLQDVTFRKNNEILIQQKHHQLNTALEATKLGRFDMDAETQQKYNFSSRFLEIFGYDSLTESVNSVIIENHIDEEFLDVRRQALEKAKETGDLYYQTKINLRDGSSRWIEFYGRLMDPVPGTKDYISGTVRDITDHKKYEAEIKESENKYRFLADSMPQIVWIGESDGRLTYFNQATMDFSGKNYNEILEENGWLDIVHPDEREENVRLWTHSVTTKTPYSFEHRFRDKNKSYKWFLSRAYPQLDEDGNVTRWVGTSTDIDDMKRQDEHKNDFIKIANHELKTPVTTIKGYVQLLKKMRGNSEDQFLVNSLNTIENQVNKLNTLIGDLLDISRIESGSLPLNKKKFSIIKLVTETIEDIKAAEESHQINFELGHANDVEVFADKDRITQVLNNLLTNAIKYSPQASEVNVSLYVKEDTAVLSVEDFGIGMDQGELDKIFDRFYRVSGADEVTFPGFGIGLFIVKDILERHDGEIWVESEKNKGSKFYVSLPITKN